MIKPQTIPARKLINAPAETIFKMKGPVAIEFDDGIVYTLARRVQLSWYHWEFHRQFPDLPALKHHILSNKDFDANSHVDLADRLLLDVVTYCNGERAKSEYVSQIKYYLENKRYNDYVRFIECYAGTISILDFIEVSQHPRILEAIENITEDEESIFEAYKVFHELMYSPEFKHNDVMISGRDGTGKANSLEQCCVTRGHTTDIDSSILQKPCVGSYTSGLRSFYEAVIESRSASKALLNQKRPMEQAEWFHRQLQLMTHIIDELEGDLAHDNGFLVGGDGEHDCGSTDYITLHVRSERDLKNFSGSFFRFADGQSVEGGLVVPFSSKSTLAISGEFAILTAKRKDVIGKVIEVRNPLTCRSTKRNSVCSTCYGGLAYSLPDETNIGFIAAAMLCDPLSQSVLSTKHLEKSSRTEPIILNEMERQFLTIGSTNRSLRLNPNIREEGLKLIVPVKDALNLPDIMISSIGALDNSYIGELQNIKIERNTRSGKREAKMLDISLYGTKSTFTKEFLRYVSKGGRIVSRSNRYIIDLSNWDFDKDIFRLPKKHVSMMDFLSSVRNFIYTAKRNVKEPRLFLHDSVHSAIVEFYELVNSKIDVNLTHLSMIVKACMCVDGQNGNYNVPLYGESYKFEVFSDIMAGRSAVSQLAHQNLTALFLDPNSYLHTDKMPGFLDQVFYSGEFSRVCAIED